MSYKPPACLLTAKTPLHAVPLVSASYGAPFTRSQQPRVAAHRTFGTEIAQDLALVASCLRRRLARATSSPGPRCSRHAALQAPPNLRRRSTTVRAFGTEGQHHSDELLLHNKTHITRVALAFPLNQHCKNSPVQPKLRVSRNRHPGRTWTKLPKAIFPNSSPSSVRAVPSSRWAELTTNSSQGENGLRNSHGRPTLTRIRVKDACCPLEILPL
jgi:hypothetical protein